LGSKKNDGRPSFPSAGKTKGEKRGILGEEDWGGREYSKVR